MHSAFLGWQIDDVEDGPNATVNIDNLLLRIIEENERVEAMRAGRDIAQIGVDKKMDRGKRPVEKAPKPQRKKGKPPKPVEKRYCTRSREESSRQVEDYSFESTTDSDDSNFYGIIDSDYDLDSEYDDDDVEFEANVDGDTNTCHEWDEMGFEGQISDEDGSESNDLKSLHGSSNEEGEDRGSFPVNCQKRFSN